MTRAFLGIDTSNYTTSVAITDESGNILAEERKLLEVKKGARGLRQSDALFLHTKNLPELFDKIDFSSFNICAVGASYAPRNVEGSYMPVFLGGLGAGKIVSQTLGVPFYEFSHQEGHIKAGIYSTGISCDDFYSIHMSGGTTEILSVKRENARFDAEIVGKTLDISAGQLIDRVGVKLGFCFPCGKALDEICAKTTSLKTPSVCVKGSEINFSGTETHFLRMIESSVNPSEIAYLTFSAIADALLKAIESVFKTHGRKKVLFVGGVASNSLIKEKITGKLSDDAYFCSPLYSTDNAVGISLMTGEIYNGNC